MRRTAGSGSSSTPLGIKVAYTPLGIVIALIFIGLPFVVRTRPAGAGGHRPRDRGGRRDARRHRLQTVFRVVLPALLPALLTGFALAFARAIGEYGSVIFIAGNIPYVSEIAPLLIIIKLERVQLRRRPRRSRRSCSLISFVLLLAINLLQAWSRRRFGHG